MKGCRLSSYMLIDKGGGIFSLRGVLLTTRLINIPSIFGKKKSAPYL